MFESVVCEMVAILSRPQCVKYACASGTLMLSWTHDTVILYVYNRARLYHVGLMNTFLKFIFQN